MESVIWSLSCVESLQSRLLISSALFFPAPSLLLSSPTSCTQGYRFTKSHGSSMLSSPFIPPIFLLKYIFAGLSLNLLILSSTVYKPLLTPSVDVFFFLIYLFAYFSYIFQSPLIFSWLPQVLVGYTGSLIFTAACRISRWGMRDLSRSTWDLVLWPGTEPRPCASRI